MQLNAKARLQATVVTAGYAEVKEALQRLFQVKIGTMQREGTSVKGKITLDSAKKVVKANPKELAWQDPKHPDCENGDNCIYMILTLSDGHKVDFCFDLTDPKDIDLHVV